jgi:hypothetical protein
MDLAQLLGSSTQGNDPNDAWLGGDNPIQASDSTDVTGIDPGVAALVARQTVPFQGGLAPAMSSGQGLASLMTASGGPQGPMQPGTNQPNTGINGYTMAGQAMQGLANSAFNNRELQGKMTQGYDKLMLDAQKARDEDESQSLKHLATTNYLQNNGGAGLAALSPYAHLTPVSAAQKQGAANLEGQLVKRLAPGGTYTPQPLDYAKPGTMENIGNYGGAAVAGLGGLNAILGGQGGSNNIPWGKVASTVGSGIKDVGGFLGGLFGGGGDS